VVNDVKTLMQACRKNHNGGAAKKVDRPSAKKADRTPMKKGRFGCPVCSETFNSPSARAKHNKRKHLFKPKDKVRCVFCGEQSTNLGRHMRKTHGSDQQLEEELGKVSQRYKRKSPYIVQSFVGRSDLGPGLQ